MFADRHSKRETIQETRESVFVECHHKFTSESYFVTKEADKSRSQNEELFSRFFSSLFLMDKLIKISILF
jgi:hypothetical protein